MVKTYDTPLDAKGLRVALVVSRFNEIVSTRLVDGALDCLRRHGAKDADLTIVRVPGSWELPQAARRLAGAGTFDAVVALGALIRGETQHFEVLAHAAARGLAETAASTGVPVILGVLTTDSLEQALDRAGGKGGNKGWDAALSAIEMARLFRELAG